MGFFNQLLLLLWKNFTLRKRQKLRLAAEIIFPLALFLILVIVRTTKPDLKVKHAECHFDGKAMPSAGILPFLQSLVCTFDNECQNSSTPNERPNIANPFQNTDLTEALNALEAILENNVDTLLIDDLVKEFTLYGELVRIVQSGQANGSLTVGKYLIDVQNLTQSLESQGLSTNTTNWLIAAVSNRTILDQGLNTIDILLIVDSFLENVPGSIASGNTLDQTLNATIDNVRTNICDEDRLDEILHFPNKTVSDWVHDELCNLTVTQFQNVFETFLEDFNTTGFLESLSDFVQQNTGRDIRQELIGEVLELYLALRGNTSWQQPFYALYNVAMDIRNQTANMALNTTMSSAYELLGTFVCGRNGSLFSVNANEANKMDANNKIPVNQDLTKTTTAPTTATTSPASLPANKNGSDLEYLKDRACVRETSPRCKALFSSLENSGTQTRFLWRQIKPFIRGCILYYPQNPVTDDIINNTQQFFRDLESLRDLADAWGNYSPSVYKFLNSSDFMTGLRSLVDSGNTCETIVSLAERVMQTTGYSNSTGGNAQATCELLKNFINNGPNMTSYDWRVLLGYVDQIFGFVSEYMDCFNFDKFIPYKDNTQMMEDGIKMIENDLFWAAIEFVGMDLTTSVMPKKIEYKIRMDVDKVDSTKRVRDKYPRPGTRRRPWPDLKYFLNGFVYIQDMIDHSVIKLQTGLKQDVGIVTQQFPYPCYTEDKFIYAISRMLPLFMILAWILTTAMLCKSIVYEKDRRLKEIMKIMGLGNGVHWMAWFINAFVMMFLTNLLLVILLKVGKVLEHSDPSAVLFFLTLFTTVTIIFCFLISVFFSRPNLAACCAGFIYFLGYLPYMLMLQFDDVLPRRVKMSVGLLSNVAFGYGCNFIALWEEQAIGLQWSNMGISPVNDDDFNMLHCITMMIIDMFLYGLATWYIEAVFPGQYGIPKPFYFPFTKSYWCGSSGSNHDRSDNQLGMTNLNPRDTDTMEAEPKDKKIGVAIRNLKKKYASSKKPAVDGLNLNFYQDQITSFLGHNGAGKTTTMSILTGLFPPTDGTAYIHGKDIRYDMDHIRHNLGTCPQHNVLFDWLTVEEHLWFYARLKGASANEVKHELEQMIKDVGLPHKRQELSSNLSGGMKRKLSVAIAFVGNSKTVILDEPTAGVDPYARRAIWQLLLKLKKGRTIILSTHHMDEADVLGDRIAIISQGQLCCVGSSLFLKNRYGNGYYLTLVRSDRDIDEDAILKEQLMTNIEPRPTSAMSATSVRSITKVLPSMPSEVDEGFTEGKSDSDPPTPPNTDAAYPGFSVKKVTSFVKKYVPEAKLVEDNMTELSYQLPDEAARRGDFERLFSELERSHDDLGVSSFGISDTSLEEVFLKVAEENYDDSDELKRNKLEEMADGGRLARNVTRLSFKRKKKLSLLGRMQGTNRVDSTTDLMADQDNESVISGPVSDYGENGFSHCEHEKVTGWRLTLRQFIAIFVKRFHHVRRSKKGFLVEIVLPVLFILMAMTFSLITPPFSEEPALELHPWHYKPARGDDHLYMFYSNDAPGSTVPVATRMEDTIQTLAGVGNRCLKDHTLQAITKPGQIGKDKYECEPPGDKAFSPYVAFNKTIDCDCSSGWQVCPNNAAGPTPSSRLLPSTDYLLNMTGRDVADWIVKTNKEYDRRSYGGLSFGERDFSAFSGNITDVQQRIERILSAANNGSKVNIADNMFFYDLTEILPALATRDVAKVWFNNRGWIASVSYMNVMNNLILRSNLPKGTDTTEYGIVAINHPMKMTKEQLNDEALYSSFKDVVISICVIFAMSFIPASFTMYLIEERVSNSKHLQFVSGVNPVMYWVTNFFWDMINYLIPCILCIFIFLAFNRQAYVSPVNGPALVCLLFLYGWAMIPLMYPFSRVFSVPSTALVTLKSVNIFLGTVSTMATFIIEFLEQDDESLKDINLVLKQVFLLLPQYCLGRGLFDLAKNQLFADVYAAFGENRLPDPFAWKQVGRNLFSMFMLGILFFTLNLLIEYNFFIKSRLLKQSRDDQEDEDADVAKERRRVLSGGAKDDVLRIEELTKVFSSRGRKGKLTAVDRLCVGVPKGQCFGLLGVNGAGKTTTFKMLTGDERLSKGNAYVNNYSILNDMVQVRHNIGYCPQFDALDPLLTGVEHLRFYARLRGIPETEVKLVADWAIRRLGLLPHADKISTNYSGGNKRKLSTAISLIGNPSVIFLDEPTTGMDPGARRFLWDCITNIVKDGRSVILTSHSMEECEALCGRLAIMVNGRFRCLGSIQHLKNKFGDGYTVIIRVSGEFPNMDPVIEFFNTEFKGAVLKEKHHNMLQYQLGSDIKLSNLFGQIEEVRERLQIEDYSVSQTTLDQVFINFAKLQTDLGDDELDELPADIADLVKPTTTTEAEGQSLAGSTAGLIRNEHRHSNHSYRGNQSAATSDGDSLHFTDFKRKPTSSLPMKPADYQGHEAPIISLPYQVGNQANAYEEDYRDDEVSIASSRRSGRPVTRFDDDGIPNAEV
ncbi:phospholipid-transporting ATPase ABCA1-like isoform X3 [Dreissena polymorpha]|uniref:phospholipid-transporting ATPase ABCA1-like isoform X3 n=1 Tax=Dreissena polymorpha TaxID=45954 RepID=UPI002264B656|nr:phospholipid-transporting ATPase ABCA1-like isoform X3 [Dreissena polymorpha]